MSSDEKNGKVSKIEIEETKAPKVVPKKSIDSKVFLSQMFSEDMIEQYKQTHRKEFEDFCDKNEVSNTDENFEKWSRLSLSWNALRYAGLFGINYKTVGERELELGESKDFRKPSKVFSQLFSGEAYSEQTLKDAYSGFYTSYYDCDESAKLFRDVVDLLWPEYGAKVALFADGHAVVVVNFDEKQIAFDMTHGSVFEFTPSDVDPLIGEEALFTISAVKKGGKNITPEEKSFWDYLPFFKELNLSNNLKNAKLTISENQKQSVLSYYKQFFYKPQNTLDLLKEMTRLYYGYDSRLDIDTEALANGASYLSKEDILFLAERFLSKPNISEDAKKSIISFILKGDAQFGLGLILFTLIASQKKKIDGNYAKTVAANYYSIYKEGKEYELSPVQQVALVSRDPYFYEKVDKKELTLTHLDYNGQLLLCRIMVDRQDSKLASLVEQNGPFMSPELYGMLLDMLVESKITSSNIWTPVISIAEKNTRLQQENRLSLASVLECDTLPDALRPRIRRMVRV
ncbi:MAG: hypothetical protein ACPL06_01155 [Candidatus Anstonellales archaeon]